MKLRWLLLAAPLAVACGDKDTGDTGPTVFPDEDGDGYTSDVDCRDDDPAINPGADEYCDGVDHNCDSLAQFNAVDGYTVYIDGDGDGYGDPDVAKSTCSPVQGYVDNADDCHDGRADINPAGTEVCDDKDLDEDCDGASDDADDSVDPESYSTFYEDEDGDGYGTSVTTEQCDASAGWAPLADDCDDDEANANPGLEEVCGDLVDNDCDGTSNACGPNGELSLGDFDSQSGGTQSGLGSAVAAFDGSFLVGAPATLAGSKGTVQVLDSGLSGFTLTGSKNGEQAGSSVAGGDMDGDGHPDALVGAPGYDVSQQSSGQGRVYLVVDPSASGGLDGYDYYQGDAGDNVGSRVAMVDIDDSGSDSLFASTRDAVLWLDASMNLSDSVDSDFVTALDGGDLDGDGFDELIVGVSGDSAVRILGETELQNNGAGVQLSGGSGDGFGASLDSGCDVDGDGDDDLLVGASTANGSKGRALLYTDVGGAATATFEGTAQYKLGTAVALVDIDGNGTCDVVVGGPGAGTNSSGVTWLYYGPLSGTLHPADADASLAGSGDFASSGTTLGNVGDLDGDGYEDLAVGAPGEDSLAGAVYLVTGGGM